jgi:hypothetical protein
VASSHTTILGGAPVVNALGADGMVSARPAQGLALAICAGILLADTAWNLQGTVQTSGVVVLPTTKWDAITGQTGGLTFGALYWIGAVAGTLIVNGPAIVAGQYATRVGLALSATELLLQIGAPIQM